MTEGIAETFFADFDIGSLIPEQFADYRDPVVDGLRYFLSNLSTTRQLRLVADQSSLALDAPIELRLVTVARHCPVLQKVGQVLARDRRLPMDLRLLLQGLESAEPTMTGRQAREIVEAELGDLDDLGISIDDHPLAEASMAVVIPFECSQPTQTRRGVFKLLKPNIQQYLDEELELLSQIGTLLDQRCQDDGIPNIDYEGLFAQVRELLGSEVDLCLEQQNMREAQSAFADADDVIVPELFPYCTARLTAMERIDGRKITELGPASAIDRRRIARRLIDTLMARPIWASEDSALFHADPHAGNLLLTADRKLAILDWGLTGRLSKTERICVTQILIGAVTLDSRAIISAIEKMADGTPDRQALQSVVQDALRSVRRGRFPGNGWLTDLLDNVVTQAQARFPSDLLLFRKTLLILEGVIADISEDCTTDNVLAVSFALQLGGEWRERLLSLPLTRTWNTHLSNADLVKLLASGPTTTIRFWRGLIRDLLEPAAGD